MTDDELIKLLDTMAFPEEEKQKWQDLMPALTDAERTELSGIFQQMQRERDILATRQANEVAQLMRNWDQKK